MPFKPHLDGSTTALIVPIQADEVESPQVIYDGRNTLIRFPTRNGCWARVTFEKLDSIKVSRGEYSPYPHVAEEAYSWVTTVSNSAWLQQRYEYEKQHYGNAYQFGGNVDEMLTDFSHYIFAFHDEFVEVLCAGIWFETSDTPHGLYTSDIEHPLNGLMKCAVSETFETHGIVGQIRRNPLSPEQLTSYAKLCSQTILEVAAEFDGQISRADWALTLRILHGKSKFSLRNSFRNEVQVFDTLPSFAEIRPIIDNWLSGVAHRRATMKK